MAVKVYKPEYPGLYYFDTFTFTTLGTSGNRGPDSTKGYANAPWKPDQFSIVDGQQQWTVPATGTYNIVAAGAYGATPGRVVSGDVDLSEGQTLTMLVGQQPTPLVANVADNVTVGGGGGTFVVSDGKPLIVASGGDGGAYSTGYLRTEFVVPSTIQFSLSMSADGNLMVALNLNVNTFQYEYAVYRYSSGVWNFETSFPIVGNAWSPAISGNGNTILLFSGQNIRVFEYVDSEWTGPNLIMDVTTWYTYGTRSFNISYDGYTVILTVPSVSYDQLVYVCTKNQDLTWNSLIQIQPAVGNYFRYGSTYVAISGDGTSICVNTEQQLYPYTQRSWVYTRTGESTWSSPVLLSSGSEYFNQIDMSYDGQTIALLLADSDIATIWLRVYTNGTLSKDLTLPFPQTNYLPGVIKLSYDGSRLLFAQYFNVTLYAGDSQITVSDTVNDFPFTAASMDSSGSRIVNVAISLTNPITYFFDAGGAGQPGSFLPSGSGSGISGAGYLTDGQQTDPFFGFLKPKAYVNGGFGNSYEYGQPGVPKEGGFGGGQSPLNKKTSLTSVTGYKQVRPSIPVNGVRQMNSIALSEDGNTFLASGRRQTGTPLNFTNVYTYIDSSWTNTNISDELSYVSTSTDGSVWLINGDVWRNGSFETTLDTIGSYASLPGLARSCISSDGNTAVVLSAASYGFQGIPYSLNVYTYSGSWNSTSLPISPEVPNDIYALQCAISSDGSTIVLNLSGIINYPNFFTFVDVYTKVGETWSSPNRIYTNTSITIGTLGINSNGSEIVFARSNQKYSLYSNGTITTFPSIENISFSRTNPDFYVYSIGNKIYAPSISLDVTININDKNSYIASGSNIIATTDSSSPYAFLFVDMYDPTTTCTAATSVDHGYPRKYEVQITGTQYFNGTWLIKPTSSNTFTFQAFGGPTVTSGYVSGTTTGISGGGGYTGSAGDGVSGATCYADESVVNFTDLGAASNTAGTVTVSLIDPPPLQATWSWDDEAPWENINTFQSNSYTVSWCESLGFFIAGGSDSTVNISKDGINWSQTILTNFQAYFVDIVSASNKPILVWGDHTSNDGTVWTYNNLPITGYPRIVYLNGMFLTSANQPEYSGYGLYTSIDGFTWSCVSPSFYGGVNAYNDSVYVGIFSNVVTYGGVLMFSNNLVDWTQTDISSIYGVAYGNGVFVAVGDGAYTSVDGQTWNQSVVPDEWIPENTSIIFGNNIFIVFSRYTNTSYGNIYTSVDGSSWVFESSYTGSYTETSITYSPSLNYFCSIRYNETPQLTLEGRYFITKGHNFKYAILDFAWSTETKTMVVMSGIKNVTSPVYIYTSFDEGNTWEEKLLFDEFTTYYNIHVVWSRELGNFFIYVSVSYTSLTILTSTDGLNWTTTIKPLAMYGFEFTKPFWCKKRGVFTNGRLLSRDGINWYEGGEYTTRSVVAYSEKLDIFISSYLYPAGACGYSYDGSHWTNIPYYLTSIAWSPSLGLFVAVGQTIDGPTIFSLYVSTNGTSWNNISTLFIPGNQLGSSTYWVTWSEELQKFYLLFAYPFVSPKFTLQESSDGYTWTMTPTPKINTGDYTYNFFWISGLDRFVLQSNENLKGLTFSTKAIQEI